MTSFGEIREKVRKALRDTFGLVFDDGELDLMIDEAQREYAFHAGTLTGEMTVTFPAGGVFTAPADYFEPVKFIGADGFEKPFISWRKLHDDFPDFRAVTGSLIRGVIPDFDGFGKFRLFPALPVGSAAGTFFYHRLPVEGKIETTNNEALQNHCLYQAFLLSGNNAAGVWYDRFNAAVNEEISRYRDMRPRSPYRRGRFF